MKAILFFLIFCLVFQFSNAQKYFVIGGYIIDRMNSNSIKLFVDEGDTTTIQRKDIVSFEHWPFDTVLTKDAYVVVLKMGTTVIRNDKILIINAWNYDASSNDANCPTCCAKWPMCCATYTSYCQLQTAYPSVSYKCVATSAHCKTSKE